MPKDGTLDLSGWTPGALEPLLRLAARLPFEEAAETAGEFGFKVSKSELERLTQAYGRSCREKVYRTLGEAEEPAPTGVGRLMVLEVDGVRVLGRAQEGACLGIEIKNMVLYPASSPSQRWMVSDVREAKDLPQLVQGLLRRAGVTHKDILVGIGDGAAWVEDLVDSFCDTSITDVYHAAQYAEKVMLALLYDEATRKLLRRELCAGKVSAKAWLTEHLPDPAVWMNWAQEAVEAVEYLDKRLERMDYPSFKGEGYPIGSGQIEGANKWGVGSRMKRSGMQWSREGAARMASMRALLCSKKPLAEFDHVRHQAYPPSLPQTLQEAA